MDDDDKMITLGLIAGFILGMIVMWGVMGYQGIDISQETGDEICRQLTGNETAVAYDGYDGNVYWGKLGCELPSYDSTQNIVIKKNNE